MTAGGGPAVLVTRLPSIVSVSSMLSCLRTGLRRWERCGVKLMLRMMILNTSLMRLHMVAGEACWDEARLVHGAPILSLVRLGEMMLTEELMFELLMRAWLLVRLGHT